MVISHDLEGAMEHPTRALAEFVAAATYEDLPPCVVHEVKRLILDAIGCAMGGRTTDIGRMAVQLANYLGGNSQATIIGGGRTSCVNAGHANARMANALDADDTFLSVGHHGSTTVCSALATGEAQGVSGKALISAIGVGFDIGARLGIAVGPPLSDQKAKRSSTVRMGTMPTATFAAASAAARILALDAAQTANAFGIASFEASVTWARRWRRSEMYTHKGG